MARRLFPDQAFRAVTVVTPGVDGPVSDDVGAILAFFTDLAGTVTADITYVDGTTRVAGGTLVSDDVGQVPDFYGPDGGDVVPGPDLLWVRVNGGPPLPIRADSYSRLGSHDDALAAVTAQLGDLRNQVNQLANGTDRTPPTAPVLSGTAGVLSASLSWTAATDASGIANYYLERKLSSDSIWQSLTTLGGAAGSYADSTPTAGAWQYRLMAVDGAQNPGPYSNTVTVISTAPAAGADITGPNPPVLGITEGAQLTLSWPAVTDRTVAGQSTSGMTGGQAAILIYRSTDDATWSLSDTGTLAGTATTWTSTGLVPGDRRFYKAGARDNAGNLSADSNHVSGVATGGAAASTFLPAQTRLGANGSGGWYDTAEQHPYTRGSSPGLGLRVGSVRNYKDPGSFTSGTWDKVGDFFAAGATQAADDPWRSWHLTGHYQICSFIPPKPPSGGWPAGSPSSYARVARGDYDNILTGMFERIYALPWDQLVDPNYAGPNGQDGKYYGGKTPKCIWISTYHEPEGDVSYGAGSEYGGYLHRFRLVSEQVRLAQPQGGATPRRAQIGLILMASDGPSNLGAGPGWGKWLDPQTGPADVDFMGFDCYWPKVMAGNVSTTADPSKSTTQPHPYNNNVNGSAGLDQMLTWVNDQLGKNVKLVIAEIGCNEYAAQPTWQNTFIDEIPRYCQGTLAAGTMTSGALADGKSAYLADGSPRVAAVSWFQSTLTTYTTPPSTGPHNNTIRLARDVNSDGFDHFRDAMVALGNDRTS